MDCRLCGSTHTSGRSLRDSARPDHPGESVYSSFAGCIRETRTGSEQPAELSAVCSTPVAVVRRARDARDSFLRSGAASAGDGSASWATTRNGRTATGTLSRQPRSFTRARSVSSGGGWTTARTRAFARRAAVYGRSGATRTALNHSSQITNRESRIHESPIQGLGIRG